jgi:hypothetical protein
MQLHHLFNIDFKEESKSTETNNPPSILYPIARYVGVNHLRTQQPEGCSIILGRRRVGARRRSRVITLNPDEGFKSLHEQPVIPRRNILRRPLMFMPNPDQMMQIWEASAALIRKSR